MTEPQPVGTRLAAFRGRVAPDIDDAEIDAQIEAEREEWARDIQRRRWAQLAPPRFDQASMAELAERHPTEHRLIDHWARAGGRTNLILMGPVGVGKTSAALAAARVRLDLGVPVILSRVPVLLRELRPGGPEGLLAKVLHVQLLILDDIGVEKSSDWTVEQLDMIIDDRWEHEQPTIATTNLPPADLQAWLGERAHSRLVGSGAVGVRLGGVDQRRDP